METQEQIIFLAEQKPTAKEPTIVIRTIKQREALQQLLQCRLEWKIVIDDDPTIPAYFLENIFQDVATRVLGFDQSEIKAIFGLSIEDDLPRMVLTERGITCLAESYRA